MGVEGICRNQYKKKFVKLVDGKSMGSASFGSYNPAQLGEIQNVKTSNKKSRGRRAHKPIRELSPGIDLERGDSRRNCNDVAAQASP